MRRSSGAWVIAVGLALGGFAWIPCAAAATVSTVVENVVVPVEGATVTIRRIEVAGSGGSGADVVALFDPTNRKPFLERLRGFASPAIAIPEIVVEIPVRDARIRTVIRDIRLVDVGGGRIGAASVGRTTLAIDDDGRTPVRADIGAMTARNVDLVQFARLFDEARAPAGDAAAPLLDFASVDALEMTAARDVHVTIGRTSASRLTARTLTVPLGRLPRQLAEIESGPRTGREKEKAEILIIEDIAASVGLGALDVRDIRVNNPRGREEIRLDRIALREWADDRLGEVSVEGFAMPDPSPPASAAESTAPAGAFGGSAFAAASVRGIDFRGSVERLNAILESGRPPEPESLFRTFLPVIDRAVLFGLHVDLPDDRASAGKRMTLALDRFEIAAGNIVRGLPAALLVDVKGLRADAAFVDATRTLPRLREFGLEGLEIPAARLDVAWIEARREILLKVLSATVSGLGTASLTATLGNAAPELFASNLLQEQAAGLALVFKSAQATVTDAGFMDKLLAAVSRNRHVGVPDARALVIKDAIGGLVSELGGSAAATAIGNALTKFVTQPQNLRIAAVSTDELGLAGIIASGSAASLLERLDVRMFANE